MSSARSQAIIEKIRAKLATVDTANRTILLVFQFNFTDSDGTPLKSFVLDLKDLKVYEGTVENPDGELTISDADFYAWANKEVTQMELLSNDKVQISGNLEGFKKLMDKFHE